MVRIANGAGVWQGMISPTSATIRQAINDEYSCEVKILTTDPVAGLFVRDAIVELEDANGSMQLFRLETPEQTLNTMVAFGWHITQDLAKDQIVNSGWENRSGAYAWPLLIQSGISERRFTGMSDIATVNSLKIVRRSVLSGAIGTQENSFVNRYGGELERDNYTINMRNRLGADKGYRIEYRKNLMGFTAKADDRQIVNRILPTYLNANDAAVTLPEVYIDSPRISDTAVPHTQALHFGDIRVGQEDEDGLVPYPADEVAASAVRDRIAEMYASGIDQPQVTVHVDFIELRNTHEYKAYQDLETLGLGDSVTLLYDKWTVRERLVAYEWDALHKEYKSITLGRMEPSMDALTAWIATEVQEATESTMRSVYVPNTVKAMAEMTASLANASGFYTTVVTDADGSQKTYMHDQPTLEASLQIEYMPEPGTRLYANTGWNDGNPTWLYGDADGRLIRNMINVNKLDAGSIRAGELMLTDYFGSISEIDREGGTNLLTGTGVEDVTVWTYGNPALGEIKRPSVMHTGDWVTASALGVSLVDMFQLGVVIELRDASFTTISPLDATTIALMTKGETNVRLTHSVQIPENAEWILVTAVPSNPFDYGQFTYRELQLEFGQSRTIWKPAQWPSRGIINETRARVEIVDGALATSVESINAVKEVQATMLQSQNQWSVVIDEIRQVTGDQEVTLEQVRSYMEFGAGGILSLGRSDSDIILKLRNDRISFEDAGVEVAYISGQTLYIRDVVVTESANIINHRFEAFDDFTMISWAGQGNPGVG